MGTYPFRAARKAYRPTRPHPTLHSSPSLMPRHTARPRIQNGRWCCKTRRRPACLRHLPCGAEHTVVADHRLGLGHQGGRPQQIQLPRDHLRRFLRPVRDVVEQGFVRRPSQEKDLIALVMQDIHQFGPMLFRPALRGPNTGRRQHHAPSRMDGSGLLMSPGRVKTGAVQVGPECADRRCNVGVIALRLVPAISYPVRMTGDPPAPTGDAIKRRIQGGTDDAGHDGHGGEAMQVDHHIRLASPGPLGQREHSAVLPHA